MSLCVSGGGLNGNMPTSAFHYLSSHEPRGELDPVIFASGLGFGFSV